MDGQRVNFRLQRMNRLSIIQFIDGAVLAAEAGFDSVDVKVCHEYILGNCSQPLPAPENLAEALKTTRALFDIIHGIRKKLGNSIDICVRLNAYDCIPYPYGWGMVGRRV